MRKIPLLHMFVLCNSICFAQQWVARYHAWPNVSSDAAAAIAVSDAGNIYVTGRGWGADYDGDYVTVKYDANGVEQWVVRHNGPADSSDEARAIAVDNADNVYVTGRSWDENYDYTTVMYDSSGIQQWVARYNGPANGRDEAQAIAVDNAGNVYVTGRSWGNDYDYATTKYDSAGIEQWVRRFDGPVNGRDYAQALVVDGSGNSYVTGNVEVIDGRSDYATVKYSPSGAELWVAYYDGPEGWDDYATAIIADESSNIYVTGGSDGAHWFDYLTIKYDSLGVEQWVARYDGTGSSWDFPAALTVDASGNAYVTGRSDGVGTREDYATIKYDSAGIEQWVARYNGPPNDDDYAIGIAVDDAGNVYVAGNVEVTYAHHNYVIVKYNSSGIEQHVMQYDIGSDNLASGIGLDNSGNVYVTGASEDPSTGYDYATIKYDSSGTELWVIQYSPGVYDDVANGIAVSATGDVYVAGASFRPSADEDYTTIMYSSSGAQEWSAHYNGPGDSTDIVHAITLDTVGNVYVTGKSWSNDFDYATIRYDPPGVENWVMRYDGPGNGDDVAYALVVDPSGSVYVTGKSLDVIASMDYATVKYDASGVEQWAARYNGPGSGTDEARAIAIDCSSNVYVTGRSWDIDFDYATVKYNALGVEQWVARYDGPGSGTDEARAIAIDCSSNVYVTGRSWDIDFDYATVKYNALGVEQWVARYNGPGNGIDEACAVAVDDAGNTYVTGKSWDSDYDYATIKYTSSGTEEWVSRYAGSSGAYDEAHAIGLGGMCDVYVTGQSGSDTSIDYVTVKYNSAGQYQGSETYNGTGNGIDIATSLAVSDSERIYVTGRSVGSAANFDIATIKYLQVGIAEDIIIRTSNVCLSVRPNPVVRQATIEFSCPRETHIRVRIYDSLGRLVKLLLEQEVSAGHYSVQWDGMDNSGRSVANGVYFCHLESQTTSKTVPLVIVK